VGEDGSVWSCRKQGCQAGLTDEWKPLRPGFTYGYPVVNLATGDGRYRMRRVNRLVLEAFVGPCPTGKECCHDDGNRGNNALGNLRWGTKLDNSADRKRHGTDKQFDKRKLSSVDAAQIRALRSEGWSWSRLATKFGVTIRPIRAIVAGETYT